MDGRDLGRRMLVGLVSLVLLAGCAAGASPAPTATTPTPTPAMPTPTPTHAATARPTPTSSPAPIVHGPVTLVAGTSTCPSFDFGKVTTDANGVQHARGGTFHCVQTTNDVRVTGESTATWNLDWWGTTDRTNGALVQWGTARLVNAGGAWEGRSTGVYSNNLGDTIVTWFKGTGGYAGLAYFTVETGLGPWAIQGQIFPGNPPTP